MKRRAGLWSVSLVVGLLTALLIGATPSGIPKQESAGGESAADKIRKALEQITSVEFQGMTLHAALDSLRDQGKLNIVLDRVTALGMGIDPDEGPITLKLNNVKLKTVLRTLLSQHNLTYVIDHDILLVTSEAMALERQVRQRVSIDLDKVNFEKALKQLARETGANLILDPRQTSKGKESVTLKLDEVPLETVVRLMAEMAGLRSVRQANVLFVTTKEVAAELRREEEAAPQQPAIQILHDGAIPGGGAVPAIPAPAPQVPPPAKPAEAR